MRPLFDDTPLEVEEVLLKGLRRRSPGQRLSSLVQLTSITWKAAQAAVQRALPEADQEVRDRVFLEQHYGRELAVATVRRRRERGFYDA